MTDLTQEELYKAYVEACLVANSTPKSFSEYTGIKPEKPKKIRWWNKINWRSYIDEVHGAILLGLGLLAIYASYLFYASATGDSSKIVIAFMAGTSLFAIVCLAGSVAFFGRDYMRGDNFAGSLILFGMLWIFGSLGAGFIIDVKIDKERYVSPIAALMPSYGCLMEGSELRDLNGIQVYTISFWDSLDATGLLYEANIFQRGSGDNKILVMELTDSRTDRVQGEKLYKPEELFAEVCNG